MQQLLIIHSSELLLILSKMGSRITRPIYQAERNAQPTSHSIIEFIRYFSILLSLFSLVTNQPICSSPSGMLGKSIGSSYASCRLTTSSSHGSPP